MNYFNIRKISHWLYSIQDPRGSYFYLIVGDDEALLFDTGYGIASLRDVILEVTDKPVTIVLGHGHVDHANGAYQFPEVWLHEADFDLFREHTSEEWRRNTAMEDAATPAGFDAEAYIHAPAPELRKLEAGQVFDLGGLHMDVIHMPGHTAGSIGLLAREHRVLLDSDAANRFIFMHLPDSLSVSQYIATLERVSSLDFDTFYTGHSDEPQPISELQTYIQVARNASIKEAEPFDFPAKAFNGLLYKEGDVAIVFNRDTLC